MIVCDSTLFRLISSTHTGYMVHMRLVDGQTDEHIYMNGTRLLFTCLALACIVSGSTDTSAELYSLRTWCKELWGARGRSKPG